LVNIKKTQFILYPIYSYFDTCMKFNDSLRIYSNAAFYTENSNKNNPRTLNRVQFSTVKQNIFVYLTLPRDFNTLRTGDADLRF